MAPRWMQLSLNYFMNMHVLFQASSVAKCQFSLNRFVVYHYVRVVSQDHTLVVFSFKNQQFFGTNAWDLTILCKNNKQLFCGCRLVAQRRVNLRHIWMSSTIYCRHQLSNHCCFVSEIAVWAANSYVMKHERSLNKWTWYTVTKCSYTPCTIKRPHVYVNVVFLRTLADFKNIGHMPFCPFS